MLNYNNQLGVLGYLPAKLQNQAHLPLEQGRKIATLMRERHPWSREPGHQQHWRWHRVRASSSRWKPFLGLER